MRKTVILSCSKFLPALAGVFFVQLILPNLANAGSLKQLIAAVKSISRQSPGDCVIDTELSMKVCTGGGVLYFVNGEMLERCISLGEDVRAAGLCKRTVFIKSPGF